MRWVCCNRILYRLFTGVLLSICLCVYVYVFVFVLFFLNNINYILLLCNIILFFLLMLFFKQLDMYIINTYKGVHHTVDYTLENVTHEHCDGCVLFCFVQFFFSILFQKIFFFFIVWNFKICLKFYSLVDLKTIEVKKVKIEESHRIWRKLQKSHLPFYALNVTTIFFSVLRRTN